MSNEECVMKLLIKYVTVFFCLFGLSYAESLRIGSMAIAIKNQNEQFIYVRDNVYKELQRLTSIKELNSRLDKDYRISAPDTAIQITRVDDQLKISTSEGSFLFKLKLDGFEINGESFKLHEASGEEFKLKLQKLISINHPLKMRGFFGAFINQAHAAIGSLFLIVVGISFIATTLYRVLSKKECRNNFDKFQNLAAEFKEACTSTIINYTSGSISHKDLKEFIYSKELNEALTIANGFKEEKKSCHELVRNKFQYRGGVYFWNVSCLDSDETDILDIFLFCESMDGVRKCVDEMIASSKDRQDQELGQNKEESANSNPHGEKKTISPVDNFLEYKPVKIIDKRARPIENQGRDI